MNRDATTSIFIRPARALVLAGLLLCVCAFLGACSAARFAYERLDWFARWQVERYVSLTDEQAARFDAGFAEVWQWHRREELPLWITELRQLAATVDAPMPTERIAALSERFSQGIDRVVTRLAPLACTLGQSLSDAQVAELLETVDADIDEFREEQIEPGDAAVRKFNLKALEKSLRRNFGALTPGQQAQLREHSDARPSIAPEWLAYRQRRRAELATLLGQRQAADFCPALTALLLDGERLWTDEQKQAFAADRAQWLALWAELAPGLTAEQRERARQRLVETADELSELAAAGG
jgi:hypothetical protein